MREVSKVKQDILCKETVTARGAGKWGFGYGEIKVFPSFYN